MAKKEKMVSINALEKAVNYKNTYNEKTILNLSITDEENIELVVKRKLSVDDMVSMVNSVVEGSFEEDVYSPEISELVLYKSIIVYYTNIKPEINNNLLLDLIYDFKIIDLILPVICLEQLNDIKCAIEKAVSFKSQKILSAARAELIEVTAQINNEQEEVMSLITTLTDSFTKMMSEFENIDTSKLAANVDKLSAMSDVGVVNNILELKSSKDSEIEGQTSIALE